MMAQSERTTALPRAALTRWLVDPGAGVPAAIRVSLFNGLYGTMPIFLAGIANGLLVSGAIALRHPTPLFVGWVLVELALAAIRLPVTLAGLHAVRAGRSGPSDLHIVLAICWAASVGFGGFISLLSGDWVVATLACVSAAAMVGGICFRNFAAPRLAVMMIVLSLGPCTFAALLSGEPVMLIAVVQLPLYMFAMSRAAFNMNRMMIARMEAELEKDYRARHDDLTGVLNRAGLAEALVAVEAEPRREIGYFFLDLDGFKRVNDTLGHAAGDQLLVDVAQRLRDSAPAGALLARLGGDEFLIVADCDRPHTARRLAGGTVRALADAPYLVGGQGVEIGASIGVALSRDHGRAFPALIQAADAALYRAKAGGRGRWVIAAPAVRLAA